MRSVRGPGTAIDQGKLGRSIPKGRGIIDLPVLRGGGVLEGIPPGRIPVRCGADLANGPHGAIAVAEVNDARVLAAEGVPFGRRDGGPGRRQSAGTHPASNEVPGAAVVGARAGVVAGAAD